MYTERHETIEERIATLRNDRARLQICRMDTRSVDDEISLLKTDLRGQS